MPQDSEYWTLADQVADLRLDGVTARVDAGRPHLGVQQLRLDSVDFDAISDGSLLALAPSDRAATWPAQLADAYVRGPDLVASYAGDENWPYAPQVYWSVAVDEPRREIVASLALVVSIQTNLLDTHPRIDVRSNLRSDEVLLVSVVGDDLLVDSHVEGVQGIDSRTSGCGILWRLAGGELSYAEVMPTSDFRQLAVAHTANGAVESRWELFAEFLEKGVIRRARLQSLWVPREDDVQLVAECCQSIANRPLPLTT